MNTNNKDKVVFVLMLLAALFTLQPIMSAFQTLGYRIGDVEFTLLRLYYLLSGLLGVSVYAYAVTFAWQRADYMLQRVGNFFFALSIVVLPFYFGLWGIVVVANAILAFLNRPEIQKLSSTILFIVGLCVGGIIATIVTRALTRRDREVAVSQLGSEETVHLNRAFDMLTRGYYDLAIVESYRAVIAALRKSLASNRLKADSPRTTDLINSAVKNQLLSQSTADSINKLRLLRNDAAHTTKQVSRESAEAAVAATKAAVAAIEEEAEPIGGPDGRDG